MKTPIENEKLLADVLADEELRASTLQAGLMALRRKRQRRVIGHAVALVLVPLAVMAMLVLRLYQSDGAPPRRTSETITQVAPTVEGTTIRVLTDQELLAFFEGRPVALIGSPGHQQLVLFDDVPK